MKIDIRHNCTDFGSYRAARVKSLFNVETGANFDLSASLPIEGEDWQIGLIVGPSGSGKSSLGAAMWGQRAMYKPRWPKDAPIVDAIAPDGSFDDVTAALASVGLGSVPSWLRPYEVLSNGERFRADLARVLSEAPRRVVIDEFTSVVDRQIAKVGALAFAKAWRRTGGQAVLLSCHYDILEWLTPDWVFDTATGQFERGCLRRRPSIDVDVWQTDWRYWPAFEPHHYLKLPRMIAATNYVATVGGDLVAHVAFSTRPGFREARACRLVVMPEWQGAGVGVRFLDLLCERWMRGENRYGKPMPTLFHTSHPGLAAALRRNPKWTQVSAVLYGASRARSVASINASAQRHGWKRTGNAGYGGHFRVVQGFRYLGETAG
jgi:GNAT superfamily N-acetyltransferase